MPLRLAAPNSTALADLIIETEEAVCKARKQALDEVHLSLDELRRSSPANYKEKRGPLVKAAKLLSKGHVPSPLEKSAVLESLHSIQSNLDSAWTQLRDVFQIERKRVSGAIREEVGRDLFREAVIWQNRRAFHSAIQPLLNGSSTEYRNSSRRKHEEMAASYLQRYCLKNESIGFFGPVGWAKLSSEARGVQAKPGPEMLAERNLYFEVWCIDRLAKSLDKIEGIKWWVAPRLAPLVTIEGSSLQLPFRGSITLSAEQEAIIRACDGQQNPKEIAAQLSRSRFGRVVSEQEVYDFLQVMDCSGLIIWNLEVPMQLHPERTLRRMIERIGDESLRRVTLGVLDEIERARDGVAKARGRPEELDEAVGQLETVFTRLTGECATRNEGQVYAARTLIFEDCRRDVAVKIGPEVIHSLTPALLLLLTSARWLTFEVAARCKATLRRVYDGLVQKGDAQQVDFLRFWGLTHPLIFDRNQSIVSAVARTFQKRWSDVLAISPGERRVHYQSQALDADVRTAFAAPGPGWLGARYHTPDIMIAAASEEAIRRGDYTFVMGELHAGFNTVTQAIFPAQHPCPEELQRAIDSDINEPLIFPVISKSNGFLMSARLMPALVSEKDYWIGFDSDYAPEKNLLRPTDLIVRLEDGDLKVQSRDGQLQFDLLDVMAAELLIVVSDQFKIFSSSRHSPRVMIDRLVVNRESWSFSPVEMEFSSEDGEVERFVRARQWARSHGIPRFVFIKSPLETKPFYCDFESPIYVDMFSKAIRRAGESNSFTARISVTEMLPTHDEAWLPDAEARRYASELRVVAVDRSVA
ncbi:MAG: lantibiotic dehydratase [Pyrinomonadaceae bacterium]